MEFNNGNSLEKKENPQIEGGLTLQENQEMKMRKNAKKLLQDTSVKLLNKRLQELAVNGVNILNVKGKKLLNSEIFYLASVAGRNTIEDEFIINDLVAMEKNGEDVVLADSYISKLSAEINAADLYKLVFRTFVHNETEREIAILKKALKETELYQQKMRELTDEEMALLKEKIIGELSGMSHVEKDFMELRGKKADSVLDVTYQDEVRVLIHELVGAELLIDEIPIILNFAKPENVKVGNVSKENPANLPKNQNKGKKDKEKIKKHDIIKSDVSLNVDIEKDDVSVENNFEIDIKKKELIEDELLRAFHSIKEITADDLDIDFVPAEKYFVGSLKDKIGELLNKSCLIDENPNGKEAEKYWEELVRLRKLGEEINNLEQENQICVIYRDNTFFINEKHETPIQELEGSVIEIVGKEYLNAFIFGVRGDYEKYVSVLRENPDWFGLSDGKKRELKEKGIIFYVNDILKENEKFPSDEIKDQICKYVFSILNK